LDYLTNESEFIEFYKGKAIYQDMNNGYFELYDDDNYLMFYDAEKINVRNKIDIIVSRETI
jgi:hypothetical protein